jgi:hypothetical protein
MRHSVDGCMLHVIWEICRLCRWLLLHVILELCTVDGYVLHVLGELCKWLCATCYMRHSADGYVMHTISELCIWLCATCYMRHSADCYPLYAIWELCRWLCATCYMRHSGSLVEKESRKSWLRAWDTSWTRGIFSLVESYTHFLKGTKTPSKQEKRHILNRNRDT